MFELDMKSHKAISDQIIDNMKELIMSGVLQPEARISSVRELAGQILVNPNTVQKAYRTLESQGYIYTVKGKGTFVADTSSFKPGARELQEAESSLRDSISRLYHMGLDKQEVQRIIDRIFDERSDWT